MKTHKQKRNLITIMDKSIDKDILRIFFLKESAVSANLRGLGRPLQSLGGRAEKTCLPTTKLKVNETVSSDMRAWIVVNEE